MFSGLPLYSIPLASNHTKGWLWLLPCARLKDRARCVQVLQCGLLLLRDFKVHLSQQAWTAYLNSSNVGLTTRWNRHLNVSVM